MSKKALLLTYALKNNNIVSIDDVESGLKCGCVCPACGEALVAKKGTKMIHHFAHHAGNTCEYGYESSLHLAAKEILSQSRTITIPAVYLDFSGSYKESILISPVKEIQIDKVELEKHFDDIIPDIVVYSGSRLLFVEIYVTHRIDESKLKKIKKEGISTIEIDLSQKDSTITQEELRSVLLSDSEEKCWKYNAVADRYWHKFLQAAEKKKIISRGFAHHVDFCPVHAREWHGKPYANVLDDCPECKYCIAITEKAVICTGKKRISNISDFDTDEKIRVQEESDRIAKRKAEQFAHGICPNCGSMLLERNGKYGPFISCSNFPHCRFTASIDEKTGEIRFKT